MPLRDHFHGELRDRRHWEGFHSAWANTILRHLGARLPARYYLEPEVHLGVYVEADLATFEEERVAPPPDGGNGVATAVWAPPQPTQTLLTELPAQDAFEVRVYDEHRGSHLVAVVELVSPRNNARPEARQAFVLKCAGYLQAKVALVVVDVVTDRHHNLHTELMQLLRLSEREPWPEDAPLYAVAYRVTKENEHWQMDTWNQRLALGAALPTLPLWLASNFAVPLELEPSYEETCKVLRLP